MRERVRLMLKSRVVKALALFLAVSGAISAQPQDGATAESDQQKWALAASAILAQRNGDKHDLLGGRERTPDNINYARRLLAGSWGVRNRQGLIDTLRDLRETGWRAEFTRLGTMSTVSPSFTRDPDNRRRMEIVAAFYPKFGSKSILAWDFMRYISLCRWGYLAGFFPSGKRGTRSFPQPGVCNKLSPRGRRWAGISWSGANSGRRTTISL